MIQMHIELVPDVETSARRRPTNATDGLVYLLECNYATLEDLRMRKSSSQSSIRRQAGICEGGLDVLRFHVPEAMESVVRLRCPRVGERLRRPTWIEAVQNEYAGSGERWAVLEIGYGSWAIYGRLRHGPMSRWTAEAGVRNPHALGSEWAIYHGTPESREEAAEQLNRAMLFMLARAPDEVRMRRDLYSMSVGQRGPGFLTNHSLDSLRSVR